MYKYFQYRKAQTTMFFDETRTLICLLSVYGNRKLCGVFYMRPVYRAEAADLFYPTAVRK